jgi:glycerol-3-phosphate acyltransferase PlsY
MWFLFAFCAGAYLIGNINPAILYSKFVLKNDVRKIGSGNPGATNILRNFGTKTGLLIMFLDIAKGAIPALIGLWAFGGLANYNFMPFDFQIPSKIDMLPTAEKATLLNATIAMYACGLSAIVGHCFPVFLKFRGGKGAATMVGFFLAVNPILTIVVFILTFTWGIFYGYASIGTFAMVTTFTLWEAARNYNAAIISILIAIYCLVIYTHRTNIHRLLTGKEKQVVIIKRRH